MIKISYREKIRKAGRYYPDSYFNKIQLKKGTKIELEHTDNIYTAKNIAKDHLLESQRYYKELDKLEKRLKIK